MILGKEKKIGITEATQKIGISPERLRYWEQVGIISPAHVGNGSKPARRYSEEDIAIAIEIKNMVENEGFSLKGAAERLNRPYKEHN